MQELFSSLFEWSRGVPKSIFLCWKFQNIEVSYITHWVNALVQGYFIQKNLQLFKIYMLFE